MNGAHDLGGIDGFGAIGSAADEPIFHAEWERRVFAMALASGFHGRWNIDMGRFAREDTDPLTYLRATYYEQWLRGLRRLLVERGLVSASELASGQAEGPGPRPAIPAARVAALLAKGGSARRAGNAPARFQAGDAVRVKNAHPQGHTRMPRYCRGRVGVIERDHGIFVFPDSNAINGDERPQHCYAVCFSAESLWGADAEPRDRVYIDLWDDYLEPA
ncbi:MAG: nitrile hydratase subunit beta [Alphaproteobacteria bacterium]|nr:nitrile hydratase subunit beta [Alphaproteobacteria bacterium]